MDSTTLFGGVGSFIIIVFLVIPVGILWFCLPFAMFRIKPVLDEQTKLLSEILAELKARGPAAR